MKEHYSFKELCESGGLTPEEKETAKQIITLLNGRNLVEAQNALDFCKFVFDYNSKTSVDFEE